jgi:hypothetical protein
MMPGGVIQATRDRGSGGTKERMSQEQHYLTAEDRCPSEKRSLWVGRVVQQMLAARWVAWHRAHLWTGHDRPRSACYVVFESRMR